MVERRSIRKYLYLVIATAIGAATIFLAATTFAPTTEGLALHAVGYQGAAAIGNRDDAAVFVSAYNEAGSIRGIAGGSFSVAVLAAPAGADPVKKAGVSEPVSGIYKVSLTPELSQHRWSAGTYVIGITFTSANGSGVVLAELAIGE